MVVYCVVFLSPDKGCFSTLSNKREDIDILPERLRRIFAKRSSPLEGRLSHPGRCNICGNSTNFYYTEKALYREQLFCQECRTTSRYRSIARGILDAISDLRGVRCKSIAGLNRDLDIKALKVYDTQASFYWDTCCYPIPDLLSKCSWIEVHTSLYKPDQPRGARLGNDLTNQNLEALTFDEASFDIVITSDVMEHVRLDSLAHREIRRILRPGGRYIFTVPHYRHTRNNLERVAIIDPSDPEQDQYVMEKEYHGDANSEDGRALAYRVYGTEIDETLKELGFEVEYSGREFPKLGILNTELFYCVVPD